MLFDGGRLKAPFSALVKTKKIAAIVATRPDSRQTSSRLQASRGSDASGQGQSSYCTSNVSGQGESKFDHDFALSPNFALPIFLPSFLPSLLIPSFLTTVGPSVRRSVSTSELKSLKQAFCSCPPVHDYS